ncbi:DegT/DnrJ/EryC1/StrS family aminotransferase [Streptomyces sp. NPDC059853]|uniref:DegT/DnrJ/EryC1/StrS family aminotransferase n=1 Tax=Streptomyces sp. NPDC059853 TaxID=3346973 RepID=UPI0036665ADB
MKSSSSDTLALHGGSPVVTAAKPHFSWPIIDNRTHMAIARQLDESISLYNRSGMIARVEDRLRAAIGVEHALLTNSGTSALHSMYVACDLGPGDEVICPVYTFFATATPLFFTGAIPVLVDCGSDGNISPAAVEAAITPRTKAIVATHMWGIPCDMEPLVALAERHGLMLLEDTSHAYGATCGGRNVGSFGRAAAQSLQGQKPLTGGEGGVLLTNDAEVYRRGIAVGHYNVRCKQEIPTGHRLHEFAVTGMGLKFRIHPLAAAIVDQQMDCYDEILMGRTRTATRMAEVLGKLPGLTAVLPKPDDTSSWYAFILRVDDEVPGGAGADMIQKALLAEGALEADRPGSTRPLAELPLFRNPGALFPAYRDMISPQPDDFPQATQFHESIIKLPVWNRPEDDPLVDQYLSAFLKVWKHLESGGSL